MPYAKNKIRVNVPKRSGFDKSHRHSGSFTCGTLVPLLCDELIPNSRVSLKVPISVQLPPLASDTYMNVKYKVEAFFVPSRLLCGSFEDFFCDFPRRIFSATSGSGSGLASNFTDVPAALPVFSLDNSVSSAVLYNGSLLDYLGIKTEIDGASSGVLNINPLPILAYHLIWQEYYRNPRVQNPAFAPHLGVIVNNSNSNYLNTTQRVPSMIFEYFHRGFTGGMGNVPDNTTFVVNSTSIPNFVCADGLSVFGLRQRNFGLDYFTGARVSAQQGLPMSVDIDIPAGTDAAGGSTGFTIAQLRAANSLQQFRERNNIPSPRLVDQVKARYGANLSDGVAQRPICIGSASYDLNTLGVNQTAPAGSTPSSNPFSSVASQYGRGYAQGNSFVINDFTASEPGYLMLLGSLVPEVTYSSGVDHMFKRYLTDGSITDMACSLLQNVGDQPIFDTELLTKTYGGSPTIFGYTDRYADFMYKPNRCSGEMRSSGSLKSFVLQRSFGGVSAQLTTSFLEIPTTYMDGVMAASTALSKLTGWFDCYFQYKVSMPLAEYSIPSLQDPAYEHGESVVLSRNGQIF